MLKKEEENIEETTSEDDESTKDGGEQTKETTPTLAPGKSRSIRATPPTKMAEKTQGTTPSNKAPNRKDGTTLPALSNKSSINAAAAIQQKNSEMSRSKLSDNVRGN